MIAAEFYDIILHYDSTCDHLITNLNHDLI